MQEAREPRHAVGAETVVAIGNDAAHGRWIGTLCIAEPAADAEAQAIDAFDHQRAEHAGVLAAPGCMPDHACLGILV